jgi:hypothetical protein
MTVWRALESAYGPDSICPAWLWGQLIEMPKIELERYHVFRGHFCGILEPYLGRELLKFTLLRDPVKRTISYYYYIRQLPEHPHHSHAQTLSLRDFCTDEETRHLIENYQAGYLSSFCAPYDPTEIAKRFTPEQTRRHLFQAALEPRVKDLPLDVLCESAQNGLSRFHAVGTVESLEVSMRVAGESLGYALPLPNVRQNVTPERIHVDELDEATLDVIRRVTRVDRILYNQVAAAIDGVAQKYEAVESPECAPAAATS